MNLTPQKYTFTKADKNKVLSLGYIIKGDTIQDFPAFINNVFPNLNLLAILVALENNFTQTTTENIKRTIQFDSTSQVLLIDYNNQIVDEKEALFFVREFSKKRKTIEVEHKYCILPAKATGMGHIKPVFQESLQQYINCNLKRIKVHAGLSGGGYTWAKFGFRGINRNEIDVIIKDAKTNLTSDEYNTAEKIYLGYYGKYPKGKSFPLHLWAALDFMKPVLMGSDWHGELDLKNKQQLKKFINYVYR